MYQIRPITAQDDAAIAAIIRQVSTEFGLAADAGFAVGDTVLDHLSQVYHQPFSQYWVICDAIGHLYGGGGIAPLQGDTHVLEIQKMYFLPEIRRLGLAQKLLTQAFDFAKLQGFSSCYLETTASLSQAVQLYEKLGFQHLKQPLGQTGHSSACEIWMQKML